jgi:hypothetical protein
MLSPVILLSLHVSTAALPLEVDPNPNVIGLPLGAHEPKRRLPFNCWLKNNIMRLTADQLEATTFSYDTLKDNANLSFSRLINDRPDFSSERTPHKDTSTQTGLDTKTR